eukprot:g18099.t1
MPSSSPAAAEARRRNPKRPERVEEKIEPWTPGGNVGFGENRKFGHSYVVHFDEHGNKTRVEKNGKRKTESSEPHGKVDVEDGYESAGEGVTIRADSCEKGSKEKLIESIREKEGNYNVLNNNCQHASAHAYDGAVRHKSSSWRAKILAWLSRLFVTVLGYESGVKLVEKLAREREVTADEARRMKSAARAGGILGALASWLLPAFAIAGEMSFAALCQGLLAFASGGLSFEALMVLFAAPCAGALAAGGLAYLLRDYLREEGRAEDAEAAAPLLEV